MPKNVSLIALACLGLLISACTRSITSDTLPTSTEDPLSSVFNTIATQTALAAGGKSLDTSSAPSATSVFGATATLALSSTPIPTATNTPAPITDLAVPRNYTLHEGEWPYCLARRFNIDPAAILSANGLTEQEASNLSVGAKLVIPVDQVGTYGANRQLRSHPASYTTTGADSFYSIACAYGDVWPEHIAEANGMELEDEIRGGIQLYIP
ncbi:MAG: LysM peptidoglycan-binding domain-containing protein [Anaerolineales bacterium]